MSAPKPLDKYQLLEYDTLTTQELRDLKSMLFEKLLDIHEHMRDVDNEMAEIILEERQKEMMYKLNIVKLLLERRGRAKKT